MRVRLFSTQRLNEKANGNSLRPSDWALVSYINDVIDVPATANGADICREVSKIMGKGRVFTVYVREDSPNYAHEIISPRTTYGARTRALKMWCLGSIQLRKEIRIV